MVAGRQRLSWRWGAPCFRPATGLRRHRVICARCFHAFNRLSAEQSASDRPLSPAERFRQNWSKPQETAAAPPPRTVFTLDELAKATHKQPTISKIEKAKSRSLELIEAQQEDELRQIEEDLENLEALHGAKIDLDWDVFEGERTRGYAGLLPLAGRELITAKQFIKQGSLIETRGYHSNEIPSNLRKATQLLIIVTDRYLETHRLCYAVNSRGNLAVCRPSSTYFTIPNFAPLEQVKTIDDALETAKQPHPKFPDRVVQVVPEKSEAYAKALTHLTSRLNAFTIEKDRAVKEAQKMTKSLYDLVRHSDSTYQTSVFTPEVANLLFQTDEPSHAQLYATHKLLADDPMHFTPDPTRHLETASFIVRAQRDILLVQRVSSWIRDDSEALQEFMDKCRKLIEISRSLPSPLEPTRLQYEIPRELWFNSRDRRIIEYIAGYVTGRRAFIPEELLSLAPMVLKRLGMYGPDVIPEPNRNAAKLLLTEIGAWQTSENLAMHTDAALITQQIFQPRAVVDTYAKDNLSGYRHDFGTQTVYVIDDASAHELDDGISMETTSEGAWLHVHIANPSAFFAPESHIAKMARLRMTSLYLPDTAYPMLPTIGSGGDGFTQRAGEIPTMTFSARLGEDGNILDYKVRPGIVRNVKVMTYDTVDSNVFSAIKTPQRAWWTASYTSSVNEGKEFDRVSDDARSHILSMANAVAAHRQWRFRNGALKLDFPRANVNVSPATLNYALSHPASPEDPTQPMTEYTIPTFVRGYAGVKVSFGNRQSPSSSLIEEMMIIAGRVASLAARENNLPVAYRGLSTSIPKALMRSCRDIHLSGDAILPVDLSRQVMSTAGTWNLQISPKPQTHELLGIPANEGGYVQVSSPLRRYLDVLAHWQFEALFKQKPLPFTFDDLSGTHEFSLHQASRRLYRRIHYTRQVNRFFVVHALCQLIRDPSSIGSTHLELENGKMKLTGYHVDQAMLGRAGLLPRLIEVPELGVQGMLQIYQGQRFPRFGDRFAVEIEKVDDVLGQISFRLAK